MTFPGGKTRKEPNQPQALQYSKDKIRVFWGKHNNFERLSSERKCSLTLKEVKYEKQSHVPNTRIGH